MKASRPNLHIPIAFNKLKSDIRRRTVLAVAITSMNRLKIMQILILCRAIQSGEGCKKMQLISFIFGISRIGN